MQATYLEVGAEVRYWEDATVNCTEDKDGTLTPLPEWAQGMGPNTEAMRHAAKENR